MAVHILEFRDIVRRLQGCRKRWAYIAGLAECSYATVEGIGNQRPRCGNPRWNTLQAIAAALDVVESEDSLHAIHH